MAEAWRQLPARIQNTAMVYAAFYLLLFIVYIVLPFDLIPEAIFGPFLGYLSQLRMNIVVYHIMQYVICCYPYPKYEMKKKITGTWTTGHWGWC